MNQRVSSIEKRETNRSINLERSYKQAQRLVKKHVDFDVVTQSKSQQEVFNIMWQKFDYELKKHKSFRNYRSYVLSTDTTKPFVIAKITLKIMISI